MKKISIFSMFLLIFSFFIIFTKSNNARAEGINGYSISVVCIASNPQQSPYQVEDFVNTLKMDYSFFKDGGNISLNAIVTETEAPEEPAQLSFKWKKSDGTVITQSKELQLSAILNSSDVTHPIIEVGTTTYVLTVTNETNGEYDNIEIRVNITDLENNLYLQTSSTETLTEGEVSEINFHSKIPTTSLTTYTWLIKIPNTANYQEVGHDNNFTFNVNNYVSYYGYGNYKIMVIGEITSTKAKFYSEIYNYNAEPGNLSIVTGAYHIKAQKVSNSLAQIEAFEYTLSDTTNMIEDNIYWYINGTKVATGKTFLYEPTTTDSYKIIAKYKKESLGKTIYEELASYTETPKPTGMYILYIAIGSTIAIVGLILFISIKISNKKRDVVW